MFHTATCLDPLMNYIPVDQELYAELVHSFEIYRNKPDTEKSQKNQQIKLCMDDEVIMGRWLMQCQDTRAQLENIALTMSGPGVTKKQLQLFIFNILWANPESDLSSKLHALYDQRKQVKQYWKYV